MRAVLPSGEMPTSWGPTPTGSLASTWPPGRSTSETVASALLATTRVDAWADPAASSAVRERDRTGREREIFMLPPQESGSRPDLAGRGSPFYDTAPGELPVWDERLPGWDERTK